MFTKLKQNYLYIIEVLIFIYFFIFHVINTNEKYCNSLTLTILIIGIIGIILASICFSKIKDLKIENKFLILIIIIGSLYCVAFPVNTIPDEASHAKRAYEISSGNLISRIDKGIVGNELDSNLNKVLLNDNYSKVIKNFKYKETKKKTMYSFANTALYSPISYLPQSLGILLSKIFTKSILIQLYFGRLFNFIVFILLMYYAIKLIPVKKEIIFLIGMLPLTIQEAISLSPDAFTISVSCFLIAYILNLGKQKDKISKKQLGILLLLSIILSQLKIVYFPICLLLFLLPTKEFKSKKQKYITIITIILISVIFGLIWLKITSPYLLAQSTSDKQLTYIFENILRYLVICTATFTSYSRDWLYQIFGMNLGNFTITLPSYLIFGNIVLFIMYCLIPNNDKNNIKGTNKFLTTFVIIAIVGLMFTSLYLQWTPYKAKIIEGIQGRYFIPLLLPLSLILCNNSIQLKGNVSNRYIDLFLVFENLCALAMIFISFI